MFFNVVHILIYLLKKLYLQKYISGIFSESKEDEYFLALDMDFQTAFQKAYASSHVLNPYSGVTIDLPALGKSFAFFPNVINENGISLLFLNQQIPLILMSSFWNNRIS